MIIKRKMYRKPIAAIMFLIVAAMPLAAGQNEQNTGKLLEISLAFIGPADALYSWWGHVAVIIENTETGTARYYDYGNFSFEQDSFVRNFVMGRLYFLKMASDPDRQLRYSAYLNRDVTIYKLNVSPENALELLSFLENDILPENRVYLYDHFYDNCSTRIRDMMDIITDGEFSRAYDTASDKTLRMQLRRFTWTAPFMDWLLNFALSGTTDRPATVFDGMFLPAELERGAAAMILHDADGQPRPFVKEKIIYNRAEGRRTIPEDPPPQWQYGLLIGMLLAAAALLLSSGSDERRIKRTGTALFSTVTSFILAVPGSILFFMAFFTNHTSTHWNMNLLFVNPFLFVTFTFSLRALIRRTEPMKGLQRCWVVTAAGALISILLKFIPLFRQDNWETLLLVMPSALVMSGLISRLIRAYNVRT